MKTYSVIFGTGDPRGYTGLAPTFIQFWNLSTGTTNAPPSIAETVSGKTGVYKFQYGVTQPIAFLIDAATTSPGTSGRYVSGQIDPVDRVDEVLGTTADTMGSTSIDPTSVVGFLKRAQEMLEGGQTYTKASGILQFFSRSATLIQQKTIADTSTTTTKS